MTASSQALQAVQSSSLAAVCYLRERASLLIEFHSGAVYLYEAVDEDIFQGIINAPSKGAFFNQHVRGRYEYHRLRTDDPNNRLLSRT